MKSKHMIGWTFISLLYSSFVVGGEINTDAVKQLKDLSSFVCDKLSLGGNSQDISLDVKAKAELSKLVGGLVEVGVKAAAKYENEKYLNVLRKDLSDQLYDARKCRLDIWNDMKHTIVSEGSNTSETTLSTRYGAIAQLKIKDGDSRGFYSAFYSSGALSRKQAIDEAMNDCKKHNSIGCAVSETISGEECAISYFINFEIPKIVIGSTEQMTLKMYKDQCGDSSGVSCTVLFVMCANSKN